MIALGALVGIVLLMGGHWIGAVLLVLAGLRALMMFRMWRFRKQRRAMIANRRQGRPWL